jgi:uncharacterized membrane protein
MRPRLLKLLDTIQSSYWFIPMLMAITAIIMGAGMVYLHVQIGSDWLMDFRWYQANTASGAREVLSTIAGSAITVAGVVFSITIVTVSFAAGQYGPRVLSNFMRDRGNQITLGTFIATFLYCIIVLRTIRGGTDGSEFVPDVAIIIALLLALCSIAVLIFFIHHIPHSIHANTLVAKIGRQLVAAFGRVYPEFIGEARDADRSSVNALRVPAALGGTLVASGEGAGQVTTICSPRTGYIETVDDDGLMRAACAHDLVLHLDCRPGDFIHKGRVFARAWPRERVSDEAIAAIEGAFAVGAERTPLQDTRFLIDQLVEVGARALSPGINDPFTAIACLDWLGAGLSELARREIPSPLRADADGALRVVALPLDFTGYVHMALGQFRQYLAGDSIAAAHALHVIDSVIADCQDLVRIAALREEAAALASLAQERLGEALAATLGVERAGDTVG